MEKGIFVVNVNVNISWLVDLLFILFITVCSSLAMTKSK